jgi:hypothetical protein
MNNLLITNFIHFLENPISMVTTSSHQHVLDTKHYLMYINIWPNIEMIMLLITKKEQVLLKSTYLII